MTGHSREMQRVSAANEPTCEGSPPSEHDSPPSFTQVYEAYFDFVWRSARRLGVPEASVDDVVQDVFVTVYRRLHAFEGRSLLRTWIFGIVRHTVNDLRRTARRKPTEALSHDVIDTCAQSPHEHAAHEQGTKLLQAVLDELSEELREVFVLSELEQMSAPEVAAALELNVNTVYSRLRTARREFDAALKRMRCRDEWRAR